MIIEEHIEYAIKALMSARSYVSTNSVPIREFRDNSKATANLYGVIHVSPAGKLSPNYHKYRIPVEIICISYTPKDKERQSLETLYEEAFGLLNTTTAAAITAALPSGTKVTVDGIVPQEGDEDIQDNFQILLAKAEIFATYTPA